VSDALLHHFTDAQVEATTPRTASVARAERVTTTDWRDALPVLTAERLALREPIVSDAPALLAMLSTEEVSRFISPPPTTVEGFVRFIEWTRRQREAGAYICFVIVPDGQSQPVGLLQVRQLEPGWATAEWGFAVGSGYWGTGLFRNAARAVVDFAFGTVGVHRLEARAAAHNGRGNGALAKLGAVREGNLRRSFLKDGRYYDQVLWSIVREEWMQPKAVWSETIH